jgi:hypothetical protein
LPAMVNLPYYLRSKGGVQVMSIMRISVTQSILSAPPAGLA